MSNRFTEAQTDNTTIKGGKGMAEYLDRAGTAVVAGEVKSKLKPTDLGAGIKKNEQTGAYDVSLDLLGVTAMTVAEVEQILYTD